VLKMSGILRKPHFAYDKEITLNIKQAIKLMLDHLRLFINRRPRLRHAVLALLTLFPALKSRLKQAVIIDIAPFPIANNLADLTPHARRVYADIKMAIANSHKESR